MQTDSPPALRSLAAPLLLIAASLVSCAASTPTVDLGATPAALYRSMTADMDRRGGSAAVFEAAAERQLQREAELLRRVEEGEIRSAEEHFHAGAVLVRSDDMATLLQAESLGRKAAILGDERGKPVAAEAVDRQALVSGAPQTYGTQYVYNVVTGNWQVYLVDPETTDEERAEAGLPPLSWFQGRVRQLNESDRSERLRRELKLPPSR